MDRSVPLWAAVLILINLTGATAIVVVAVSFYRHMRIARAYLELMKGWAVTAKRCSEEVHNTVEEIKIRSGEVDALTSQEIVNRGKQP